MQRSKSSYIPSEDHWNTLSTTLDPSKPTLFLLRLSSSSLPANGSICYNTAYDNALGYTLDGRHLAKLAILAINLASGGSGELGTRGKLIEECLSRERERYLPKSTLGMKYTTPMRDFLVQHCSRLLKADNHCNSAIQPCKLHRRNQRKERMKAM